MAPWTLERPKIGARSHSASALVVSLRRPLPVLVFWRRNVSMVHVYAPPRATLTPTPSTLRGMRTSALFHMFGTRPGFPHVGRPIRLPGSFSVFLTERFFPSFKPKKEENKNHNSQYLSHLPSCHKTKATLKEKLRFFYFFVFQIQGTISVKNRNRSIFTPRFSV